MLYIQETWISVERLPDNAEGDEQSRRTNCGESEVYETSAFKVGELFQSLQRDYGRCCSKLYVDGPAGTPARQIGWVFEKAARYEDTHKPFIRETWVSVHDAPPTKTTAYHYTSFTQ